MSQRPTRKMHREIEHINLNITPIMNLFVVLIPFLLSSAVFIQISTVDSTLPKLAEASTIKNKNDDKLVVTVKIRERGIDIGRVGYDRRKSRQSRWERQGDLSGTISMLRSGEYDFKSLANQMVRIKSAYPNAVSVLILPEGNVAYEHIIGAMDATREIVQDGETKLLFPDAVLGHTAEKE